MKVKIREDVRKEKKEERVIALVVMFQIIQALYSYLLKIYPCKETQFNSLCPTEQVSSSLEEKGEEFRCKRRVIISVVTLRKFSTCTSESALQIFKLLTIKLLKLTVYLSFSFFTGAMAQPNKTNLCRQWEFLNIKLSVIILKKK